MGVRPGYKRTEVGIIPEDWDVSTVGQQFSVQLGKMLDAKRNVGVAKPYLGNRAVQWNRIDIAGLPSVPLSPADLLRFRLEKGDLLACEGGEVGRAAIWDAPLDECYYQKALHRLRPLKAFDPRFMVAILHRLADRGMLANYVTQTSIAHLPRDKFIEIPIPLPPVTEQHVVATALSDVDALLGGLDRLIAKKRHLKQAAMQQLLTGQTRLPGFSGDWELKRLGELGATYGGLAGKSKGDFGHGDAQYIPFMNVMGNVVIDANFLERVDIKPGESQNRVQSGDCFFNGSSETPGEVGMCASLTKQIDNLYLNSFCFGFRLKTGADLSGLYLANFFRSRQGRDLLASLAQGSTRYNLSKRALLSVECPCPTIEEQIAITETLSDMDAELAALEARRDKTRDLKQAMMQELLTGKTRLVAV